MTDDDAATEQTETFKIVAKMMDETAKRIRQLNDDLRMHRLGGSVVITAGIAGLGPAAVNRIFAAIAAFDAFTPDNDPYDEHDCVVMTVDGTKIIWKIDYYDLKRRFHSSDASDPSVTSRVMTVMRADEY